MEIIVFLKILIKLAPSETYMGRVKESQGKTLAHQIRSSWDFFEPSIQKQIDPFLL